MSQDISQPLDETAAPVPPEPVSQHMTTATTPPPQSQRPVRRVIRTIPTGLRTLAFSAKLEKENDSLSLANRIKLVKTIKEAVWRVSDIMGEGTRLFAAFVAEMMRNNGALGIDLSDITHLRHFFTCLFGNPQVTRRNPHAFLNRRVGYREPQVITDFINNWYAPRRPANMPWIDGRYLGQIITAMVIQYHANCQVHVVSHVLSKYQALLTVTLWREWNPDPRVHPDATFPGMEKLKSIAHEILAKRQENRRELNLRENVGELTQAQIDYLVYFIGRFDDDLYRHLFGDLSLIKADIKRNWFEYLPSLGRLLTMFENENLAVRPRPKELKSISVDLFSIVPISSLKQKYIIIDTEALYELQVSAGIIKGTRASRTKFHENMDKEWRRAFYIDTFETINTRFHHSIRTDGISARVHVERPNPEYDPTINQYVNDWGYGYTHDEFHPMQILKTDRVIGLDPGQNNVFAAAWDQELHAEEGYAETSTQPNDFGNLNRLRIRQNMTDEQATDYGYRRRACRTTNHVNWFLYPGNTWREESGYDAAVARESQWNSENAADHLVVINIPTRKTLNMDAHVRYYLQHRDILMGFYRPEKWRHSKRTAFILRQKAHANIARMLLGTIKAKRYENVIVAFGGSLYSNPQNHKPAIPSRALFETLQQWMRVRLTPERLTSTTCSDCLGQMHKSPVNNRSMLCRTNNCMNRNGIDRDINAARNIRRVFLYKNGHQGRRPNPFFDQRYGR